MSLRDAAGAGQLITQLPVAGGAAILRRSRALTDELTDDLSRWMMSTFVPLVLKVPGTNKLVTKIYVNRTQAATKRPAA